MKYSYGLLVSLMVCSSAWAADDSLAKIQTELGFTKTTKLCGQFTQDKKLAGIAAPVHSSGHFCVDRSNISWITDSPTVSTLTIDSNKLTKIQDGTVVKSRDATDPTFQIMRDILPAIADGNASPLTKSYSFAGTINGDQWQATLTPRNPLLVKATGTIHLQGDKFIRQFSMSPGTGDQTTVLFTDFSAATN